MMTITAIQELTNLENTLNKLEAQSREDKLSFPKINEILKSLEHLQNSFKNASASNNISHIGKQKVDIIAQLMQNIYQTCQVKKANYLGPISADIWKEIFSLIPINKLPQLAQVNQFFFQSCWSNLLMRSEWSSKEAYLFHQKLTHGLYTYTPVENKQNNQSVNCLQKSKNLLFSGHQSEICVWDLNDSKFSHIATLAGHTDLILCMQKIENFLFSGSKDNTIRVWNFADPKNITFVTSLESAMESQFSIMKKIKTLLFSAHGEKIYVWDAATSKFPCVHIIDDETPIKCLQNMDNLLISGANDMIKIYDTKNNFNCMTCVQMPSAMLHLLKMGTFLFSAFYGPGPQIEKGLAVWDLANQTNITCIATFNNIIFNDSACFKKIGKLLFVGNLNNFIFSVGILQIPKGSLFPAL